MEELRGDSRINIVGDGEREERHASPGTAYVSITDGRHR